MRGHFPPLRSRALTALALFTLAPAARAQSPTATIPIRYEDARVYVPVRVGRAAPRWFILDTGAQPTLLDEPVATSAGIAFTVSTSTTGAGGRSTRIGFAPNVSVMIGSIPLGPQRVTVAPLDSVLAPSTGRPIPGIIGSRFFAEHVVEIDVARSVMRVYDPATFVYRGHGIIVPVELDGNVPYTAGWIAEGGTRFPARFLVDFGAKANTLVTEHFAADHALAERAPASVVTEFGAGMGGETRYRFVRAGAIGLAGAPRSRVDSLVIGLSDAGTLTSRRYDALLGAQYLARFRVILDYARGRIILEPRAGAVPPDDFDMSGLYLIAPDSIHRSVVIRSVRGGTPAATAGLRSGDVITNIDELAGAALTVASARARLRSRDGRRVTIRVDRDGRRLEYVLTLKRAI